MPPLALAAFFPSDLLPAILANQFAPISADFQLNVYNVLSAVALLVAIYAAFRRKPTVDVDLSKLQAAIETLQRAVEALSTAQARHASHDSEITALKERVRALDGLRESDAQTQRNYIAKLSRDIFDRIEGVEKSFADNIQKVERTLGQIEGKIDVMRDRMT